MFGLHSVPMSPQTDVLHKEDITASITKSKKRRSMFDSIFGRSALFFTKAEDITCILYMQIFISTRHYKSKAIQLKLYDIK